MKQNWASDFAVICMAIIVAVHTSTLPKTNTYLLVYQKQSDLIVFEGRTSSELGLVCASQKDTLTVCQLNQTIFSTLNYRKEKMERHYVYIHHDINITSLPNGKYLVIKDHRDWKIVASKYSKSNMCKRCASSTSARCKTLTYNTPQIRDCKGNYVQ